MNRSGRPERPANDGDQPQEGTMHDDDGFDSKRRYFLTRLLPGCALACAGCSTAHAVGPDPAYIPPPPPPVGPYKHKFDMPYDSQLTVLDYYRAKYEETVGIIQALTMELGKANVLQMIQTYSEQKSLVFGTSQAEQVPVNDFASFINAFRDPGYDSLMTMQIVEDTPTAFEVRITECVWAATFQELAATDIGYLLVCHADHTWAEGFNPAIKLTRDQTLMQGHALCNHRYTYGP